MKKLIATISISALLPFMALASGVTMDTLTVTAGQVSVSGTASYDAAIPAVIDEETEEVITPEIPAVDTLTVAHDGENVLTAQNLTPWSASFRGKPGTHEVSATVGGQTVTATYRFIMGGGILNSLGNYCGFLWGPAFSNCSQTVYTRVIPFGQEGCVFAWGCKGN